MHRNTEPVPGAIGENAGGGLPQRMRGIEKRAAPGPPIIGLERVYRSTGCGSFNLLATRIASKYAGFGGRFR